MKFIKNGFRWNEGDSPVGNAIACHMTTFSDQCVHGTETCEWLMPKATKLVTPAKTASGGTLRTSPTMLHPFKIYINKMYKFQKFKVIVVFETPSVKWN